MWANKASVCLVCHVGKEGKRIFLDGLPCNPRYTHMVTQLNAHGRRTERSPAIMGQAQQHTSFKT